MQTTIIVRLWNRLNELIKCWKKTLFDKKCMELLCNATIFLFDASSIYLSFEAHLRPERMHKKMPWKILNKLIPSIFPGQVLTCRAIWGLDVQWKSLRLPYLKWNLLRWHGVGWNGRVLPGPGTGTRYGLHAASGLKLKFINAARLWFIFREIPRIAHIAAQLPGSHSFFSCTVSLVNNNALFL